MYGLDVEFLGYSLAPGAAPDELAAGNEMVQFASQPAAPGVIKMLLAELRVSTKARAEQDDDLALGFQVYATEVARYPADCAAAAIRKIARREKFYPALAELRDELQRESRRRKALADVLRN